MGPVLPHIASPQRLLSPGMASVPYSSLLRHTVTPHILRLLLVQCPLPLPRPGQLLLQLLQLSGKLSLLLLLQLLLYLLMQVLVPPLLLVVWLHLLPLQLMVMSLRPLLPFPSVRSSSCLIRVGRSGREETREWKERQKRRWPGEPVLREDERQEERKSMAVMVGRGENVPQAPATVMLPVARSVRLLLLLALPSPSPHTLANSVPVA